MSNSEEPESLSTPSLPGFQFLRVIFALMVREMITRYGRSWGGYFWAIAEPVFMIAILSLAISQFVETPPIGESFILFYSVGFVPFHFFTTISSMTSSAVAVNKSLMYFPVVTPLDAVIARGLLAFLTMIVVAIVVLSGAALLVDEPVRPSPQKLLLACGAASVLGMGAGTFNVFAFSVVPVWKQIWEMINRPLFLISGIFFIFESMPDQIQALLWWNPLLHVTAEARAAFYPIYDGAFIRLDLVYGLGVGLFLLGGALLIRNRTFVIENS